MGNLIGDETKGNQRCGNVILAVVWISLIGSSVTLFFLIFCIIKMIKKKKEQITTLTTIILLIFFGEVVLCISKLLQILKTFKKVFGDGNIICLIQIFLAIYADFCSLVCTFLLSLKCYDVLKYKNKYFSNGKHTNIKIIIFTVLGCFIVGVIFSSIDLAISGGNDSSNFASRDECSYWCWLGDITNEISYAIYFIFLIVNIILFVKICRFLNRKHKELSIANEQMIPNNKKTESKDNIDGINNELKINDSANYSNLGGLGPVKIKKSVTNEVRENNLILIKIKCKIYPLVTIIFWVLAGAYRIFDDILMRFIPDPNSFSEYPNLAHLDQGLLVIHTFLVSIRGLLYGVSFILFEENVFGNFLKKFLRAKKEIYTEFKDDKKDNENNEEESSEEEDDEEDDKKGEISTRPSVNTEMNTSEVRFVEE